MKSRRFLSYFLILTSTFLILTWLDFSQARAEIISISDQPNQNYQATDPIFIPEKKPPKGPINIGDQPPPEVDGNDVFIPDIPVTPISLDGNDYLHLPFDGKFQLKVDQGEAQIYDKSLHLLIDLKPLGSAPEVALNFSAKVLEAGHFEIEFMDFDPAKYELEMLLQPEDGAQPVAEFSLKGQTKLDFLAFHLEAVRFKGNGTPAEGEAPDEYIGISSVQAIYNFAQTGELLIKAQKRPDPFIPPPGELAPKPPVDNGVPPGSTTPTGSGNPTPSTSGNPLFMGGAGGLFDCSLHPSSKDFGKQVGLPLFMWGIFLLVCLYFRNRRIDPE